MRALVMVALAAVLVGCSAPTAPAAKDAPATAEVGQTRPTKVRIPTLNVDANIIDLHLKQDGTLEVPPDAKDAGWYVNSPVPGRNGPSVIAAHVNWKGVDGPFAHLDRLHPGDEVVVEAENGAQATFKVTHLDTFPKDQFNSDLVYGDTSGPELRLVTCTGDFDAAKHSYRDNLVVSAQLAT